MTDNPNTFFQGATCGGCNGTEFSIYNPETLQLCCKQCGRMKFAATQWKAAVPAVEQSGDIDVGIICDGIVISNDTAKITGSFEQAKWISERIKYLLELNFVKAITAPEPPAEPREIVKDIIWNKYNHAVFYFNHQSWNLTTDNLLVNGITFYRKCFEFSLPDGTKEYKNYSIGYLLEYRPRLIDEAQYSITNTWIEGRKTIRASKVVFEKAEEK